MSTLGDAADVNPVIKFLPHTCVTIPATVPQRSEIPEGLMNDPVCVYMCVCVCIYIYIHTQTHTHTHASYTEM